MSDIPITFKVLIIVSIAIIAIAGNLLTTVAFARNPRLRTLSNMFVLSLAICDLLFSCTVMPLSAFEIAGDHTRIIGQFVCGLTAHLSCSLSFVAVEMLTLMAVNRYFKIVKPVGYPTFFTKRSVIVFIFLTWTCGIIFGVLSLLMSDWLFQYLEPIGICIPHGVPLVLLVSFIICTGTIILCYRRIFIDIRQHHTSIAPSLQGSQHGGHLGANVEEIKITKKLSVVVVSLFSCYVLAAILGCVYYFTGNRFSLLLFTGGVLRYLSSALNPLIYGFSNRFIKHEFLKILRCRF